MQNDGSETIPPPTLRWRRPDVCSIKALSKMLTEFVPITRWLPNYKRANLLSDMIGGLTLGVMVVPQGMAYVSLAGLPPAYGLYSSFFPCLLYMILGTSQHVSLGVFGVISLMVGTVLHRVLPDLPDSTLLPSIASESTLSSFTVDNLSPIVVVGALTLTVGLVHLCMAVLQLSFLTVYLSDQVIGGFTTGAACHVLASQLDELIGVTVRRYRGPFKLFYNLRDMTLALPETNLATLIISVSCIAFLLLGRELVNPAVRKRSPIPIPFELIAVVVGTTLSAEMQFHTKYSIAVAAHIPIGFPSPTIPRFDLMPQLLGDAVGIAIVVFVVTVSVGKLFAKKHGYRTNPAQELRALGITQCLISLFSCHPASASLTRALLSSQIGVRTQLAQIFAGSLLLIVIVWIGPLLEPLPMCILASITIVALKGMFAQFKELIILWKVSRIDFAIWLVSFLSTACWDVTEGLAISIIFALLTVVWRSQWPKSVELGRCSDTDFYDDISRFDTAKEVNSAKVLRFQSPLLFTNVQAFEKHAYALADKCAVLAEEDPNNNVTPKKALIVDCSGLPYVDSSGMDALKALAEYADSLGIEYYFASCNSQITNFMERTNFYKVVPKARILPSVNDAVLLALESTKVRFNKK